MCGIFGFWLKRELKESDILAGKKGMELLQHRGPDSSDYWVDEKQGIFLGHNRLSIIDLSKASNQPMERENSIIVYNGELYNYKEIREELREKGINFISQGDTEVVLQAWLNGRERALDKFDGMFAFVIYNKKKELIDIVTDPFGEKPLYLLHSEDGVFFSSEAGPLVKIFKPKVEMRQEDYISFLSMGTLMAPATGYRNLWRIPPGHHIGIDKNFRIKKKKYYFLPEIKLRKGKVEELTEKELDEIQELLVKSLKVRLRSDVPLGVFLSSGVDSSLITAMIAKDIKQKVETFTVSFPDSEVPDEAEAAAKIAGYLNLPHNKINSIEDPSIAHPEKLFELYGEINDNLTVFSAYQMSRVAAKYIRVALAGIGGDELFYGYNRYQFLYGNSRWINQPDFIRKIVYGLTYFCPFSTRVRSLHNLLSAPVPSAFYIAAINNRFCKLLWGIHGFNSWVDKYYSSNLPVEIAARQFDLQYEMPSSYIPPIERGSMRVGLEVRTPFLNRKLLEYISVLDQRSFIVFGQKNVLRRILQRYLPKELVNFPKRGFIFPTIRFLEKIKMEFPVVSGLNSKLLEKICNKYNRPDFMRLALRLLILSRFLNMKQS